MCWHKWSVKEQEILPSFLEQTRGALSKVRGCDPADVSKKDCIVTYICTKCSAEKVERI